jgi:hypothetical protein
MRTEQRTADRLPGPTCSPQVGHADERQTLPVPWDACLDVVVVASIRPSLERVLEPSQCLTPRSLSRLPSLSGPVGMLQEVPTL